MVCLRDAGIYTRLVGSPRQLIRFALLGVLTALWCVVGVNTFSQPFVDGVSQYDITWAQYAARPLVAGEDPYSPEFALKLAGDRTHSAFPYPLASLWLALPLAPLPTAWAALIWVSLSMLALMALAPIVGSSLPQCAWLTPLLLYPSLYALKITQWVPVQMGLLALSLWLVHRNQHFCSG